MEITIKIKVPEGANEKEIKELAEIFAQAYILKVTLEKRRKKAEIIREKASWRELREYLEEYRNFFG
ncbi:hypothetical protein [Pyrococcus kukulkanii]|uniref:hypothetical protein n=1 Tax=Pyrococcus kukulkanii TaxID=1609559 RepID=UPI003569110F